MKKQIIIALIAAVILSGGSFFGGAQYQKSKNPFSSQRFAAMAGNLNGNPTNQRRGIAEGQIMLSGEVLLKDETSLTLKLQDNSSKLILFSENVPVKKTSESNLEAVALGEQVLIQGKQNQDGSITAQSIQVGSLGFNPQTQPSPTSSSAQGK